jgi:hypothetical protein
VLYDATMLDEIALLGQVLVAAAAAAHALDTPSLDRVLQIGMVRNGDE